MTDPLSDAEKHTLKVAAFGTVALVANADPGFFALLRESFAATGALDGATGLVRDVFASDELPALPEHHAELEAVVLPALRGSVDILRIKAPDEVAGFAEAILSAADRAAAASHGIRPSESAVLGKVREALGAG